MLYVVHFKVYFVMCRLAVVNSSDLEIESRSNFAFRRKLVSKISHHSYKNKKKPNIADVKRNLLDTKLHL